jgi:hypothetical protein
MLDQLDAEAPPSTSTPQAKPPGVGRLMRLALAANIFLSAFLLFQVQLIIGKYLLPMFGGAPSTWITCILCFQLLLLAGYCYSHLLSARLQLRGQGTAHAVSLLAALLLLAIVWLQWPTPLTPGADWKPQSSDSPVWKISQLLAVTVAVPFFVLSTTGPLFQNWFARIEAGRSPYRLYALSNTGSLLGLLSYPFLFEWLFTLKHQAQLWSTAYVAFAVISLVLAWRVRARSRTANTESTTSANLPDAELSKSAEAPSPSRSHRLLWVTLSACSSAMLLATTNLLCQDLTSLPLLWVLPLSLYLLSFILTFDNKHWYHRIVSWPIFFVAIGLSLRPKALGFHGETPDTLLQMALYCFALFAVCMVCHGELARSKPAPRYLTSFYLLIGTGGAIGGLFVVLLAPVLFSGFWEFRVALLACGALLYAAFRLQDRGDRFDNISWTSATAILFTFLVPHVAGLLPPSRWSSFLAKEYFSGAVAASVLAIYYLLQKRSKPAPQFTPFARAPWPALSLVLLGLFGVFTYVYIDRAGRSVLYRERNFFGVKYVLDLSTTVDLMSGSTIHGVEVKDRASQKLPTMYFRRDSGIGLLIANFPRGVSGTESLRIGVIGLGIGTLAAYGHPADYFHFYEIDPALLPLSLAPHPYFHFLKNTTAAFDITMGDARLSLEREAARGALQQFNVLAVDAFSSDAVPVHLLTREAMDLYLRHLRTDNGVLAFHVSSRFVDLAPVIVGLTDAYALHTVQVGDKYSLWILASQNPEMLRLGPLEGRIAPVALKRKPLLWTDDYSNVEAVLIR